MKISKRQKQALKWILVAVCIGIIGYTFRDSAGPIFRQLRETAPIVVVGICLMSLVYYLIEGWITTALAKQYHSGFSYMTGVKNALYCAFCRVATLGSGAGVAASYYLGETGRATHADQNQLGFEWLPIATLNAAPLYPSRLRRAIMNLHAGLPRPFYLGNESVGDPEITD